MPGLLDLWEALKEDLGAGRDAFVRNMQRASGGGILSEGETDTSARGAAGMNLGGLITTGSMPGGLLGAPAGAIGSGATRRAASKVGEQKVKDRLLRDIRDPADLEGVVLGQTPPPAPAAPAVVPAQVRPQDVVGSRSLFDYSRLGEIPDVPQTDLPRYVPPRGPSSRLAEAVDNPAVRQGIAAGVDRGVREGGHFWYNNDPLLAAFREHLGETKGPAAFRDFMGYVSATSPSSRVPLNVRLGSYYYHRARQGDDFSNLPNPPPGYGSKAQQLHKQNVANYQAGTWDPLQNPKPISFAENLSGNFNPATVDTHAFRPFGILSEDPRFLKTSERVKQPDGSFTDLTPRRNYDQGLLSMDEALKRPTFWESVPNPNEYGLAEQFYRDLGRTKGLAPAQTQATSWVGLRDLTGMDSPPVPFLAVVDDVVTNSANLYGISPQEMLKRLVTGASPLHPKANAR